MHCFRPPRGPCAQERGAGGSGGFQRDWPGGPLVGDRKAVLGEGDTHLGQERDSLPRVPRLMLLLCCHTCGSPLQDQLQTPKLGSQGSLKLYTNGSLQPSQAPLLTPNIPGLTEVFVWATTTALTVSAPMVSPVYLALIVTESDSSSNSNHLHQKVKRQLKEWEKLHANHKSDTGSVPRTYKECLQSNNKKTS